MKFPFGRNKKQPSAVGNQNASSEDNLNAPLDDSGTRQPFSFIHEQCTSNPAGLALAGSELTLTNGEYLSLTKKVAQYLRSKGIKPGEIVATAVSNDSNFVLMGALLHEGAIGCTLPSFENLPEWVDWVISATPQGQVRPGRHILWDSAVLDEIESLEGTASPNLYSSPDDVCRLVFSSGTTGVPKGIPFTVRSIQRRSEWARRNWMPADPFMSLIPLSGVSGTQAAYWHLMHGMPYLSPGKTGLDMLRLLEKYEAKSIKGSPMQLEILLSEAKRAGVKLPSLSRIQSAGMLLPARLAQDLFDYFGAEIVNLFGCSESGTIAVRVGDFLNDADMGEILPSAMVQVVNSDDELLPVGTEGIIRWKTEDQAKGYFKSPTATITSFRDGWFYSGDEGYLTDDGHLYLTGRTSELLNLGGRKLNPARLDEAVKALPNIADAACFSFNDGTAIPKLGIAIVKSGPVDRQAVETLFLKEYQALRPSAVIAVGEIPRGALDKVQRATLAKQVEAKLKR